MILIDFTSLANVIHWNLCYSKKENICAQGMILCATLENKGTNELLNRLKEVDSVITTKNMVIIFTLYLFIINININIKKIVPIEFSFLFHCITSKTIKNPPNSNISISLYKTKCFPSQILLKLIEYNGIFFLEKYRA